MQLGLDSTLVAARVDLRPGLDSEEVELAAERIKNSVAHVVPEADQIFLDVTEAPADKSDDDAPAKSAEKSRHD